jgi:chloramphenicol 3-O-phosphotransferase
MRLVLLHGPPGVGKLTVAKELQPLTGYGVFHNHLTVDLVASLFSLRSPTASQLRERIWLDTLGTAARDGIQGVIFTLVFEPTLLPGFFERLLSTIRVAGGTVRPFELRCTPEENARRVVQPDRERFLKETNASFLLGGLADGAYDPPPYLPDNTVIDTTHLPATETARRIHEALNASKR